MFSTAVLDSVSPSSTLRKNCVGVIDGSAVEAA